MRLQFLEILPSIIYISALLILGFRNRGNAETGASFILGSRQLTLPAFVATLVTTWYGGILGVGEFTWLYGISNWFVFGLPYYIFAAVFAIFLAPKIQSSSLLTIPDQFYKNFGSESGLLSSIFTFFMVLPAPYILMLGFLISWMTGISLWICIIIGAVVSMLYVLNGGFNAVVQTDKLQFLLMFSGFIMLFFYLTKDYGGIVFLQNNLPELHLTWHGGNSFQTILVWFFIAAWTFIDPGFHQRCYAAKSPKVAQKGIFLSILFWACFDFLTTACGLYTVAILDPSISPTLSFPILGQTVLPPLLSGLFLAGLLATIMSTVDSFSLLSAVTIGHDVIAKFRKSNDEKVLLKFGLLISAIFSILLAISVPSVINIWLLIGNVFIPPLLLPLLACYFPQVNPGRKIVLNNLIYSFVISFFWLIMSILQSESLAELYFIYNIPPMFPGIFLSVILFTIGILRSD